MNFLIFIENINSKIEKGLEKEIEKVEKEIKYFEMRYENLIGFIIAIIIAYILLEPNYFKLIENFIYELKNYGIIGIFITGSMYTISATGPVAAVVIFIFGEFYPPVLIALVGALGSCIVDYFIFIYSRKFLKFKRVRTLKIYKISKIKKNPILRKLSPFIAFFIFASPLPDELASIFLEKMEYDKKKFFIISYFSNFVGILIISSLGMQFL